VQAKVWSSPAVTSHVDPSHLRHSSNITSQKLPTYIHPKYTSMALTPALCSLAKRVSKTQSKTESAGTFDQLK
jgi:hypothetical protein